MQIETKTRPMLFSGPLVRAILAGRKTQTRRVLKVPLGHHYVETDIDAPGDHWLMAEDEYGDWHRSPCPHGKPGDLLWVRETWAPADFMTGSEIDPPQEIAYRADKAVLRHRSDGPPTDVTHCTYAWNWSAFRWKPSIHMPRWASRITLEVTDVRVERVCEIRPCDAIAEGIAPVSLQALDCDTPSPVERFRELWDEVYAKRGAGWESNPWVWVVGFRRLETTHA